MLSNGARIAGHTGAHCHWSIHGGTRLSVPLFQALEVHPEALAALAMFQQAAALESATAASVRRVLAFLEKLRGGQETLLPEG